MLVTFDFLISLGVLFAVMAAAILWARHGWETDGFDQDVGVPEGTSFLDALLHCATCPRLISCHKYIEDQRAKTGRVDNFCPRSDFLLRLTGRSKSRQKAVSDTVASDRNHRDLASTATAEW